jgi:hypothetical protein
LLIWASAGSEKVKTDLASIAADVATLDVACHAGGRGLEFRRSR